MRAESPSGRPSVRLRSRTLPLAAALTALTMVVSGCGGQGGDSADGVVELRFSWWGSDERHAMTQEVIELFEEQNPGIKIVGEYTDWASYWDKLATTTAAGDAPDIITQEERYLREYAERGALLDLSQLDGLDLSKIDPLVAESGDLDGATYGVATGVNAYAILADPQAFADAGVDMPDDDTWTWDDYVKIAAEISEKSNGEIVGTQAMGYNETGFAIFAESVEIEAGGPDQSVLATNKGAMAHFWTNQLGAISASSGREIELLRYPGETEHERTGMYFKPAMYYSISAGTEHPEEAAKFVDFLLNSEEAAAILLADRGLPANVEVRESIVDALPEADRRSAEFLAEIEGTIVDGNPPPPIGAAPSAASSSSASSSEALPMSGPAAFLPRGGPARVRAGPCPPPRAGRAQSTSSSRSARSSESRRE